MVLPPVGPRGHHCVQVHVAVAERVGDGLVNGHRGGEAARPRQIRVVKPSAYLIQALLGFRAIGDAIRRSSPAFREDR